MAGSERTNPIPSEKGYLHCYKSGDPQMSMGSGVLDASFGYMVVGALWLAEDTAHRAVFL